MTTGIYSNLYYPTRWVPLRRRGLGWQRCNELYEEHRCIASCGLAYGKTLEIVLDIKGCNLNCKYCWGWKMRYLSEDIRKTPQQVVEDILCRAHHVINDRIVAKSKYAIGVIRITGNEPTLQWKHLIEVLRLLGDEEVLVNISEKRDFDNRAVKAILNSKAIIETNGVRQMSALVSEHPPWDTSPFTDSSPFGVTPKPHIRRLMPDRSLSDLNSRASSSLMLTKYLTVSQGFERRGFQPARSVMS